MNKPKQEGNIYEGQTKEYLEKLEANIENDCIEVGEDVRKKIAEALANKQ